MNHPRRSFVVRLLLDHAQDHNWIQMNLKTKKLSVTIPRCNPPKFDTTIEPKSCSASRITTATQKVLAAAQRDIEIARERVFFIKWNIYIWPSPYQPFIFWWLYYRYTWQKQTCCGTREIPYIQCNDGNQQYICWWIEDCYLFWFYVENQTIQKLISL